MSFVRLGVSHELLGIFSHVFLLLVQSRMRCSIPRCLDRCVTQKARIVEPQKSH